MSSSMTPSGDQQHQTSSSDKHDSQTESAESLTAKIKAAARGVGFDLVGIAPAVSPVGFKSLVEWLENGFAGEMQYLPRRAAAYEHPESVMPNVASIVMLAINYCSTDSDQPTNNTELPFVAARVAQYAHGSVDYHDLLREKLKRLADVIHQLRPHCRTRGIVDTAPLLERDFARLAGLGWFGKNTMLINKRKGSWLLLAALLTNIELVPDAPHETSHCGTCTRCLDVCPTDAFPAPYVLDARRCIAYLTIELRKSIPLEFREGIGDWLFGCDLCQDVCPWNRKAPRTTETLFEPQSDLNPANAVEILGLDESEFTRRFANSPLARPGWEGMRRNAAIVIGNSGDASLISFLQTHSNDTSALVREAVIWAAERLAEKRVATD